MVVALRTANVHAKPEDAGIVSHRVQVAHSLLEKCDGSQVFGAVILWRHDFAKECVPRTVLASRFQQVLTPRLIRCQPSQEQRVQLVALMKGKVWRVNQSLHAFRPFVQTLGLTKVLKLRNGRYPSGEIERDTPKKR